MGMRMLGGKGRDEIEKLASRKISLHSFFLVIYPLFFLSLGLVGSMIIGNNSAFYVFAGVG